MAAILRQRGEPTVALSAALGWLLALAAVAAGWIAYGWRGVLLALTVTVFWLLLQFTRSVRVLRDAAARPVGQVPNAVMFNAGLARGMRLQQILKVTRSLGLKVADDPETFVWTDAAGDSVRVELRDGAVSAWALQRADVGA